MSIDRSTYFEDEDGECLNTVEDLAEGIIKIQKNTSKEYTILLVGETGTGKTTFLSLLANVLAGHSPNDYVFSHDQANEAGGGDRHSQTNFAKLYEFKSKNGVSVRILDTPGLADTRGLAQDEKHKDSIASAIKDNIVVVNAVLILANGTLPRLSAATEYALSTLSSIFPRNLAENIGIIFTNVSKQLSSNFDQNSLPQNLRNPNNQFRIDNPVALWQKYLALCSQSRVNKRDRAQWKAEIQDEHLKALRSLVSLFDWLDGLVPQPTTDILRLRETIWKIDEEIFNFLSRARQMANQETRLEDIINQLDVTKSSREQYQDYTRVVNEKIWIEYESSEVNMMCRWPDCHLNCPVFGGDSGPSTGKIIASWALSGLTANPIPFVWTLISEFASAHNAEKPKCPKCCHPSDQHCLGTIQWRQEDKPTIAIDEYTFQRYSEAKSEVDRQEVLKTAAQATIDQLRREIESCLSQVQVLVSDYAELSLSGSFSGHVGKTIVLLELHIEVMRQNGDVDSARNVEESLKKMKETLDVLERARTRNATT